MNQQQNSVELIDDCQVAEEDILDEKEVIKYCNESSSAEILPSKTVCVISMEDTPVTDTSHDASVLINSKAVSKDLENGSPVIQSNGESSPTNVTHCNCRVLDSNSLTEGGLHVCKGESDKQCEVFMQDLVQIIFSSSVNIDQETCAKFDDYCKSAAGRRNFAELLNQRRVRDKLVEEETFFRLVQFFAICLFECNETEDFSPATTLMNMCFTFYHDPKVLSNGNCNNDVDAAFLYTHLRDQLIWKSMRFWEVAFFTAMHQERSRWGENFRPRLASAEENREVDEMEENTTFGQLGTILHNMRELDIPKDVCLEFLEKTSAIGNLKPERCEILREILNSTNPDKGETKRIPSNGDKGISFIKKLFKSKKKSVNT